MLYNESELFSYLEDKSLDAIVVEGYDGVGKGRVLELLSQHYGVVPYRPDYNLWNKFDHRYSDRWKVSGFFWDVYSHFNMHLDKVMLFDRGVMSGAVYNSDERIALEYKNFLRDMKVLHILVICDYASYKSFQIVRNSSILDHDIRFMYREYLDFTQSYMTFLRKSGVDWVIYKNKFSGELGLKYSETCAGCGHYSAGYCRNPRFNKPVDSKSPRCEYSDEKEVQDIGIKM